MRDIKWLVNRLKAMSIREILWRVQQRLLQKREYQVAYSLHKSVIKISLKRELQMLSFHADRLPFYKGNKEYSIFKTLDIFHSFDYSIYKDKWNAGFQTKYVWPEKEFSHNININQREDIGDIRTNWELNRHYQFVCLAKNYYVTGEKAYLEELINLFCDWNTHNLFLHGVEWSSSMELGIRALSWIYTCVFLFYASDKYSSKIPILDELSHGILVMADYIKKHRARFSSANNHLIVEMFAVGMAGIGFNYEPWVKFAVGILTDELPKQNYNDGVNKEMSLHYQSFVMEAYGLFGLTLEKNGIEIPAVWRHYLRCMSEYMAVCCGDNGEVIVFGDNDEGKLLDLKGEMVDYYRYVLQLMGALLRERYVDMPLTENMMWLINEEQQKNYYAKPLYHPGLVSHYKEGGYTIFRSRDHQVMIGMDHAALGFGSIAAHGHADALSIQVFYEGKPLFVDTGTFNYHVPGTVRDEIRSAKAHNTVYVNGIEQAEISGPFLWGRRYKVESVELKEKEESAELRAVISYSGIIHARKLTFDLNRKIIVEDIVKGVTAAVQEWHLGHVDGEVFDKRFSSNCCDMKFSGSIMCYKDNFSGRYGSFDEGLRIEVPFQNKVCTQINLK